MFSGYFAGFHLNGRGFRENGVHYDTQTLYDHRGFDIDEIHFETQTRFDLEGYDCYGYDANGMDKRGNKKPAFITEGVNQFAVNKNMVSKKRNTIRGFNEYNINCMTGTHFDPLGFGIDEKHMTTGTYFNPHNYNMYSKHVSICNNYDVKIDCNKGFEDKYSLKTGKKYDEHGLDFFFVDKKGFDSQGWNLKTKSFYDNYNFSKAGVHKYTGTLLDENYFYSNGINYLTKANYDMFMNTLEGRNIIRDQHTLFDSNENLVYWLNKFIKSGKNAAHFAQENLLIEKYVVKFLDLIYKNNYLLEYLNIDLEKILANQTNYIDTLTNEYLNGNISIYELPYRKILRAYNCDNYGKVLKKFYEIELVEAFNTTKKIDIKKITYFLQNKSYEDLKVVNLPVLGVNLTSLYEELRSLDIELDYCYEKIVNIKKELAKFVAPIDTIHHDYENEEFYRLDREVISREMYDKVMSMINEYNEFPCYYNFQKYYTPLIEEKKEDSPVRTKK